jgi:hypothetical protein
MHMALAWAFVTLFALTILTMFLCRKKLTDKIDKNPKDATLYTLTKPVAENVKAVTQMFIGVATVLAVGWRLLYSPGPDPSQLIFKGVGIGLALAAAIELAYTLFTPGPDEALDPLMLAVSATILLKLSQIENTISLADAGAFLLLGVLLVVLFVARLLLAERSEEEERPNIWWIPYRHKKPDDDQTE